VSSNTLSHLGAWQDQFIIAGIAGIVLGVIAVVGLKELSPQLRDQIMVTLRDRALIEARARGLNVEESMRHPWRQMLRLDIVGSAFAIGVFLIFYYTAVGFFTVYFAYLHGFSLSTANSLGDWFWAFDAGGLILVGIVSDRFRVRKPFMVLGGVGVTVMTIVFLSLGAKTSFSTFAVVISFLAVFQAIAYAPWMASFTETVEQRNPALIATGLAVYGWVIRAVVAISILILPTVVSSMTPLVTYGAQTATIAATYPQQVATLGAIDAKTGAALLANPANPAAGATAVGEIAKTFSITPAAATSRLLAVAKVPKADQVFLAEHGTTVTNANAAAPGQWKDWWWVCVGGEIVFLPFIFLMAGRWSPRKARQDEEEHERKVKDELAALG
jgi:hypothetical protein